MLKARLIFAVLILGFGFSATKADDYLPALHQIRPYTFSTSYSCGGNYKTSALFLSSYSQRSNAPDLLYNGPCTSQKFFQSNTAGDDFAIIRYHDKFKPQIRKNTNYFVTSLIGNVSLEEVTATMAFQGLNDVGSTFQERQPAIPSMSYVALLSKSEFRALIAFRVQSIANATWACDIEYAVLSYSIQDTLVQSPGWDWYAKNNYTQSTPSAAEVEVSTPIVYTVDAMTIMGATMGATILGLVVAVIVLGVKLRSRSGYSHIQH